jgi:hypothetical protein
LGIIAGTLLTEGLGIDKAVRSMERPSKELRRGLA